MTKHILPMTLLAIASTWATTGRATAAEICGDGIDNDADGIADDGCNTTGVTGVCESPLDCSVTGSVAPLTGQLVYSEPPDLAPTVPYGPSIAFQRTYMSKYEPGYNDPADTDFRAPMGYGWHHNFMSWIDTENVASDEALVHSVTGQEVLFTESTSGGGYQYYTPQPGFHFEYLSGVSMLERTNTTQATN